MQIFPTRLHLLFTVGVGVGLELRPAWNWSRPELETAWNWSRPELEPAWNWSRPRLPEFVGSATLCYIRSRRTHSLDKIENRGNSGLPKVVKFAIEVGVRNVQFHNWKSSLYIYILRKSVLIIILFYARHLAIFHTGNILSEVGPLN